MEKHAISSFQSRGTYMSVRGRVKGLFGLPCPLWTAYKSVLVIFLFSFLLSSFSSLQLIETIFEYTGYRFAGSNKTIIPDDLLVTVVPVLCQLWIMGLFAGYLNGLLSPNMQFWVAAKKPLHPTFTNHGGGRLIVGMRFCEDWTPQEASMARVIGRWKRWK